MRALAIAAAVCALAVSSSAATASGAVKVVSFDDLAPGTTVTEQYRESGGVSFNGPAEEDGLLPVVAAVPPGVAHSGDRVADISECAGCEFFTPRTVGRLATSASRVSAYVGFIGSPGMEQATVTLVARELGGQVVGTSSATVLEGQPFTQQLAVVAPAATIASFELVADPPFRSQSIGFDDLALTVPDTSGPPDFALGIAAGPQSPATSLEVPIAINRLNSSDGPIALTASGLPPGVAATFAPNPVPGVGAGATLRLTAADGAPPSGDATVTITGTPGPGAGSVPRTVTILLRVGTDCDRSLVAVASPGSDRLVSSPAELDAVLRSSFEGRVVVPFDARWSMTDCEGQPLREIPLQPGVELVGEHGPLGRLPLLSTDASGKPPLFVACAAVEPTPGCRAGTGGVRVRRLHLRGPYLPKDRFGEGGTDAISVVRDAAVRQGRVLVTENEIEGFRNAVAVRGIVQVLKEELYDAAYEGYYELECPATCPHPDRGDASLVRVEGNYLHNLARVGGGYGTVVGGGSYATITGNVFEYYNHSIAASGKAYSGYLAHFNYLLKGTLDKKHHHIDVHGTETSDHQGGDAGTFFDISQNTIRGEQEYAAGFRTRAVFGLRGRPTEAALFHDNVFVQDGYGEAIKLQGGDDPRLDEDSPSSFNLSYYDNRADTDYSTEIAAGDFDGDRRTDVFVANGTAWFYSSGGVRPWQFLTGSTLRVKDLAFADVDNDGLTDPVFRRDNGKLGYLKRGTAPSVVLPAPPVPLRDLRFGDFDGDGLTDIFYTQERQWHVWYGATKEWVVTQHSVTPISQMIFGEFDAVRGTDVVAVRNNQWSYSSAATSSWKRLNSKRTSSFTGVVAADFDGDGRSDIAFNRGFDWRYSSGGSGPLETLRYGSAKPLYPTLDQLLIGRFNGGRKAQVLSWRMVLHNSRYVPEWQFVLWRGLHRPADFLTRSEQNMR